mmetsp:Transcript_23602/g.40104  ORF Transcript_23602/g.40104 Transcript_23602/m.40104 type:complete len:369 (-) Transcript_23602:124-1230(-)
MSSFEAKNSSADFTIVDWSDGHQPGGISKDKKDPTRMAINHNKAGAKFFNIFDDFLPEAWLSRAYEYACERGRPWGAYVTTVELLDLSVDPDTIWAEGSPTSKEKAISLMVYRSYYSQQGAECLYKDKEKIHGVAVWCLSSGVSNEVQYHIDYAELYRYETNIIHPPLYAGTCQLSPLKGKDMIGGDFYANMSGLDHYKEFGYKGLLQSPGALTEDVDASGDWVRVRYKQNRAMLHDGDLPHFSSPIKQLVPDKRRVILGLNFFSDAVGECCIRAPEHSDAFNRTVKLYQMMSKLGGGTPDQHKDDPAGQQATEPKKKAGGITAKDIAKNPAMAKMFVLAAKKFKAVQERERLEAEAKEKEKDATVEK